MGTSNEPTHGCIVSFRPVFCVYWICSKRGTSWSHSIHSLAVSPGMTIGDRAGDLCSFTEAVRPAAKMEPGARPADCVEKLLQAWRWRLPHWPDGGLLRGKISTGGSQDMVAWCGAWRI